MASNGALSPATPPIPAVHPGPLSRDERLLEHVTVYAIGSWNLVMVNLAQSPARLWSLPLVGLWALVLAGHWLIHAGRFGRTRLTRHL